MARCGANDGGDIGDLKAFGLPVVGLAAESLESLAEERGDEVRLEPAGLGSLHVLADYSDLAGVHRIGGQCPLFDELANLIMVEGFLDNLVESRATSGLSPYRTASRSSSRSGRLLKKLAENIEHLAANAWDS